MKCTLNDEDLIAKAEAIISKLCVTGGRSWVLRVPVDFKNDPDIILSEVVRRFKEKDKSPIESEPVFRKTELLKIIDDKVKELDENDSESHIWYARFTEIINSL